MSAPFLKRSLLFVAALFVIAVFTSACSFTGVTGIPDKVIVDVTVHQSELDQDSRRGDASVGHPCHHLLDELSRVEIHDGFIRSFGTRRLPDGSTVQGSFDLAIQAEDGFLDARVIAIDIPGFDLDDPRVLKVNHELEHELTHMAYHSTEGVYFEDVVLREGEMNIKLQVMVGDLVDSSVHISVP